MKEEELIYTEKSAKPSLLKILFWILAGDFLACILYGIATGAGGSIDAQMNGAPMFLAVLSVITVVLTILFYGIAGKRVTSISVYERTVIIDAPKFPTSEADFEPQSAAVQESEPDPTPDPEPSGGEDTGSGDEFSFDTPEVKRVNPYLRQNRQKKPPKKEETKKDPPSKTNFALDDEDSSGEPEKKIGKVTPDVPNSRLELPVDQIRTASRKGKNVVLILKNDDRYLFVRMAGAEQLVRVIEDKAAAVVK